MAKTRAASDGIRVDTVDLLHKVHVALHVGRRDHDEAMIDAAESVLSGLVLVLKSRHAVLPDALAPMIDKIS